VSGKYEIAAEVPAATKPIKAPNLTKEWRDGLVQNERFSLMMSDAGSLLIFFSFYELILDNI
jgi:hypothetical protein